MLSEHFGPVEERAGEMNARKEREEGLGGQWRERRGVVEDREMTGVGGL